MTKPKKKRKKLENRNAYIEKYKAERYERIHILVDKGEKLEIGAAAAAHGWSMSQYIIYCINQMGEISLRTKKFGAEVLEEKHRQEKEEKRRLEEAQKKHRRKRTQKQPEAEEAEAAGEDTPTE